MGTNNRRPMLSLRDKRLLLLDHIKENCKQKNIYVDCINAVDDHVHCLVSIKAEHSIAKVMQLIKGESAFWANKQNLFPWKLQWQEEYYAGSVSPGDVDRVRLYIARQEEHHYGVSYLEEFDQLMNSGDDCNSLSP